MCWHNLQGYGNLGSCGGEPEMEQSREKTSLGQVLGERLEQVFCHNLALALDLTVEVYILIEI